MGDGDCMRCCTTVLGLNVVSGPAASVLLVGVICEVVGGDEGHVVVAVSASIVGCCCGSVLATYGFAFQLNGMNECGRTDF